MEIKCDKLGRTIALIVVVKLGGDVEMVDELVVSGISETPTALEEASDDEEL